MACFALPSCSVNLLLKLTPSVPWNCKVDCFLKYQFRINSPSFALKRFAPPPGQDHFALMLSRSWTNICSCS
jgi:hypothetical protein